MWTKTLNLNLLLRLRERARPLLHVVPLVRMAWSSSPHLVLTTGGLRVLLALLPPARLWVAKLIIDGVSQRLSGASTNTQTIWKLITLEFVFVLCAEVFQRGAALWGALLGERFANFVMLSVMRHSATLDLASFEDPAFCDKLDRARVQAAMRFAVLETLSGTIQQTITLMGCSTLILLYSPWFLPVLFVAATPSCLGELRFAHLTYGLRCRRTADRRELDYLRQLGTSAQSAKEVKVFGLGAYLIERVATLFESYYRDSRTLAERRTVIAALLGVFPAVAYCGCYAWVVYQAIHGALSLGTMTMLAATCATSRDQVTGVLGGLAVVSEQALYLTDLFDFFKIRPSVVSLPNASCAPRPIKRGFEFRNVSFCYPGANKKVLDGVTFMIGVNECVALVGENGAGKSTIAKLLARLYDPTEGQIFLDGCDLREYDIGDLRKEISVLFQDYIRYDMLAKENIGLGRVEDVGNLSRIMDSAHKSFADAVIGSLPQKYEQMLGRRFDGGVDLSIGQWQKIALARAYMRDAQVVILDEPTASLDAIAEFDMYSHFADVIHDCTVLLISHRFSTVRMADRILVLSSGRIQEEGTHDDLVGAGHGYAEMFERQAVHYR